MRSLDIVVRPAVLGIQQFGAERLTPRRGILKRHERHWTNAAGNVAMAAAIQKYGKYVGVIGEFRRDRLVRFAGGSPHHCRNESSRANKGDSDKYSQCHRRGVTSAVRALTALANFS